MDIPRATVDANVRRWPDDEASTQKEGTSGIPAALASTERQLELLDSAVDDLALACQPILREGPAPATLATGTLADSGGSPIAGSLYAFAQRIEFQVERIRALRNRVDR